MELSINELADLTGHDRRTITRRLEKFTYTEGPKGAHLYDSRGALAAIYVPENEGMNLDKARTEQALESAALTRARREEVEKTRPPLDLVLGFLDVVGQEAAAILKVHKDKPLDQARIDRIFAAFRELPGKLLQGKGVSW